MNYKISSIEKICVCEFCNKVMDIVDFIPNFNNENVDKYKIRCQKCGREEFININILK